MIEDHGDAAAVLSGLASLRGALSFGPFLLALTAVGLVINHLLPRALQGVARRAAALPAPVMGLAVAAVVLMIDAARPEGVAPFIYYQF